jgi:hypothetical protein
LVAWSINVTIAPGTAAPLGSVTVPLTSPVAVCAYAPTPAINVNSTAMHALFGNFINTPSFQVGFCQSHKVEHPGLGGLDYTETETVRVRIGLTRLLVKS